ncbi:hypothetical protein FDB30_04090 [Clostridium botulinum]|uniref:Uncharacterized protein n=1 Tax=Clostridium botulinum TaxID=1491 RepID=A0A846JZB2_CLOBO|nr:hypothetical protein [Clostridium botulinum]KAI3350849.1 hypothetical protein CIT18_02070 [Clostridium botulinum]KOM88834.1 hypothetical protein ACP51_06300 [Clostridium botulinum]KOR57671.1 hypothetical protein ADT22_12990 [Clostridium botulinum]NFE12381.1 hypothetical protein [Clostridium botulinum]NFE85417.1 hypothetical protein [Clostridium botulinum]
MSKSIIKINGKIDKILKTNKDGSAVVLFKNENEDIFNLQSSIIMVEITKRQWRNFKNLPDILDLYLNIYGKFEIRTLKENKTYIYVKSIAIKKVGLKEQKQILDHDDKIDKHYKQDVYFQQRDYDNMWFKRLEEIEFQDVDINNVKLVEKTHLNSRISIFNIKNMSNYKDLTPIAIRKNEEGTYELIAGLKTFIVAKLFSRNVKAYITDLDRESFKEKYSLTI